MTVIGVLIYHPNAHRSQTAVAEMKSVEKARQWRVVGSSSLPPVIGRASRVRNLGRRVGARARPPKLESGSTVSETIDHAQTSSFDLLPRLDRILWAPAAETLWPQIDRLGSPCGTFQTPDSDNIPYLERSTMNYPPQPPPMSIHRPGAFPPSPPHSIPRSSNGTGPMSSPPSSNESGKHPIHITEENLQEHHRTLTRFLAETAPKGQENSEPHYRARDKLLRLSSVQFQELSTDVYDELLRREHDRRHPPHPSEQNHPRFLQPRPNYHPKRNQARQKLATLATNRFRELAGDVSFELERRYTHFAGGNYRAAKPAAYHTTSQPEGTRTSDPRLRNAPSNPRLRGAPSNPSLRTTPSHPSLRTPNSGPNSGRTRARSSSRSGPRAPAPLPAYVQGLRRPSVNTSPNPNNYSTPISPIVPYSPDADHGYTNGSSPYGPSDYARSPPANYQTPLAGKGKPLMADVDETNDGSVSESDYDRTSRRLTNKSLPFSMVSVLSRRKQAGRANIFIGASSGAREPSTDY